jgi:NADH-quinone oxidoreductase subunit K
MVEHWTFNPQVLGSSPIILKNLMITSFINIEYFLSLTSVIFFVGLFGVVLNRKNILIIIMSIELLLLAVNLNFAIFSIYLDDVSGQVFILFILAMAAAESAIGFSIITVSHKLKQSIQSDPIKKKFTKV